MERNKSNNKIVILLVVIILCLVGGGIFVFSKVLSSNNSINNENSNQQLSGATNNSNVSNPNEDFSIIKDNYQYLYDLENFDDSDIMLFELTEKTCSGYKNVYSYGNLDKWLGPGQNVFNYIRNRKDLSMTLTYFDNEVGKKVYSLTNAEMVRFFEEFSMEYDSNYVADRVVSNTSTIIDFYYTLGNVRHNVKLLEDKMLVLNSTDGNVYRLHWEFTNSKQTEKNCAISLADEPNKIISNILNKFTGK